MGNPDWSKTDETVPTEAPVVETPVVEPDPNKEVREDTTVTDPIQHEEGVI